MSAYAPDKRNDKQRVPGSNEKTAYLINTSRGPLIVENDLADFLNEGRIAGAAMDVLDVEPPDKNCPLLTAKNCYITPHIAWATIAYKGTADVYSR